MRKQESKTHSAFVSNPQSIQTNIRNKRVPIQEVISDAEAYLRINREKLSPEQIETLQKRINELRMFMDQIWVISEQIVKETETEIHSINLQQEESVGGQLFSLFSKVLKRPMQLVHMFIFSEQNHCFQ